MPKSFIAVLDHQHLENSIFLTAFAKSLAKLGERKGIVVHGDSPYTDRLIQTGMMREDARLRAIKDLNKRLIGLFADHGVATIGIHGFQKNLVTKQGENVTLNNTIMEEFHAAPNLLISNLVDEQGETTHLPLPKFTQSVAEHIDDVEILLFSKNEKDEILISDTNNRMKWKDLPESFCKETLPEEFEKFNYPVKLTTATDLGNWPNLKKVTIIE
jgi:acetylglutamate kinase